MVKVKNSIFEHISGRAGDLIFYTRNGKTYARQRPQHPGNPRTLLQQQQRWRMRDVVAFYRVIRKSPLEPIWQQEARRKGMAGINLFVKMNIAAFTGKGTITDYGKVHFSCGQLPAGDNFRCVWKAPESALEIRWQNNSLLSSRRLEDRFMAVVLLEDDELLLLDGGGIPRRGDGQARLVLEKEALSPHHVYCFFVSADRKAYSMDIYCNITHI